MDPTTKQAEDALNQDPKDPKLYRIGVEPGGMLVIYEDGLKPVTASPPIRAPEDALPDLLRAYEARGWLARLLPRLYGPAA